MMQELVAAHSAELGMLAKRTGVPGRKRAFFARVTGQGYTGDAAAALDAALQPWATPASLHPCFVLVKPLR